MAAIDTSRAAFTSVDFFGRVGQSVANTFATLSSWNDSRETRNALSQLSDRELEDIGLCRGDIDDVARLTRF